MTEIEKKQILKNKQKLGVSYQNSTNLLENLDSRTLLKIDLQILDVSIRTYTNSDDLLEKLKSWYGKFWKPAEKPDLEFYLLASSDRSTNLVCPEKQCFNIYQTEIVYPYFSGMLFQYIYSKSKNYYIGHGASLSKENQGLLIMGAAESGKTTLALAMAQAGWTFLSDEFAPINLITYKLEPLPRSLLIRESSLDFFPEIKNQIRLEECFIDAGDTRWMLDPQKLFSLPKAQPVTLKSVVILQKERFLKPALEPYPRPNCFQEMIENAINLRFLAKNQKKLLIRALQSALLECRCWKFFSGPVKENPAILSLSMPNSNFTYLSDKEDNEDKKNLNHLAELISKELAL